MAIWADLGEDDGPAVGRLDELTSNHRLPKFPSTPYHETFPASEQIRDDHHGTSIYIAQALRCYPIAEKLASYLDLTDLASLSSTCRSLREALIQFAHQLKQHSLKCSSEVPERNLDLLQQSDEALALRLSLEDQTDPLSLQTLQANYPVPAYLGAALDHGEDRSLLGLSSKTFPCARDLVAPCRRCGVITCRNCTAKPLSNKYLEKRLRRLCNACQAAPLIYHQVPAFDAGDFVPSMASSRPASTRSERSDSDASHDLALSRSHSGPYDLPQAWLRDFCSCASQGVYLCQPCGQSVKSNDAIYERVWKWRSRYSTHLGGGLGTGLGLGNQGQKCGRGKDCLATHDAMALMETECDEPTTPSSLHESSRAGTPVHFDVDQHNGDLRPEPGYLRQEIEGIGGLVKSKSKRIVKVGATVFEFPDERESGKYLRKEITSEVRSWCSWCARVCPGKSDLQK